MYKVVMSPTVTLTVSSNEYATGAGIGGSSDPTLDPPANPAKTDSTRSVYVPGGSGISKCPINPGSCEPRVSSRLEHDCAVGTAGFTDVTVCPGLPVDRHAKIAGV